MHLSPLQRQLLNVVALRKFVCLSPRLLHRCTNTFQRPKPAHRLMILNLLVHKFQFSSPREGKLICFIVKRLQTKEEAEKSHKIACTLHPKLHYRMAGGIVIFMNG